MKSVSEKQREAAEKAAEEKALMVGYCALVDSVIGDGGTLDDVHMKVMHLQGKGCIYNKLMVRAREKLS